MTQSIGGSGATADVSPDVMSNHNRVICQDLEDVAPGLADGYSATHFQ
jgi:hypothetical protein